MSDAATLSATGFDPVLIQLIRAGLTSIVDEMSLAVIRTARSAGVREQMDFSTALCDRHGRVVAQGLGLASHLGSLPDVVASMLAAVPELQPGDVVIANDPYAGALHLPDIAMVRPLFVDDALVAYAVVNLHHIDVGGRVVGSIAPDSTEIFQEGFRIPPMLYRRGGVRDVTFELLLGANVRLPDAVLGDLEAQENACVLAERRFAQLVRRHGAATLERYMHELLDYAERMARAEIEAFPDGEHVFVDHLDDDGLGGEPVRIEARVTVARDEVTIDFTGSSPQVRGAINVPLPLTRSVAFCCVRSLMRSNIPDNEGFTRPIRVVAPLGTVLNPRFPAAVGARGVTSHRVIDTLTGALAQVAPDRVRAAGEGGSTNVAIGGRRDDGTPYAHVEFMYGNWGGRPGLDGIDGVSNLFANMANVPIEVIELEMPLEILRYGFVPNTGGPGEFRGGVATTREWRLTGPGAMLTVRSDRELHPPYGLAGGEHGAPSSSELLPAEGGPPVKLSTKFTRELGRGDIYRHTQAGGGGYGDPRRRDPSAVREDVLDGKIDVAHARLRYGVVIDAAGAIDEAATRRLRGS